MGPSLAKTKPKHEPQHQPSNNPNLNRLPLCALKHPALQHASCKRTIPHPQELCVRPEFEDFKTDNHNTTQTLAGHATTLTSHGNTLTSILAAQEKQQQDLILLQEQNTHKHKNTH